MLVNEYLDETFVRMEEEANNNNEESPLTPELFDLIVEEFEQIDSYIEEFYIKKVSVGEYGGVRFNIHLTTNPDLKYVLEYLDDKIIYWQKLDSRSETYLEGQNRNPILNFS